MTKKPIKVVYNNKPDPVVKITEYEYDGDGLKQISVRNFISDEDKMMRDPKIKWSSASIIKKDK